MGKAEKGEDCQSRGKGPGGQGSGILNSKCRLDWLSTPFHRGSKGGSENRNGWLKVIRLTSSRDGVTHQVSGLQVLSSVP